MGNYFWDIPSYTAVCSLCVSVLALFFHSILFYANTMTTPNIIHNQLMYKIIVTYPNDIRFGTCLAIMLLK